MRVIARRRRGDARGLGRGPGSTVSGVAARALVHAGAYDSDHQSRKPDLDRISPEAALSLRDTEIQLHARIVLGLMIAFAILTTLMIVGRLTNRPRSGVTEAVP